MFNALYSLDAIDDARVLDLFAGSGALGLEALSRGARSCVFVDNDRHALDAIRDNIEALGFDDVARVVAGDGRTAVASAGEVDLVLLDPPYDFDEWDTLLGELHDVVVVIESRREVELPDGWETHRVRQYGSTVVTFANAPAAPGVAAS